MRSDRRCGPDRIACESLITKTDEQIEDLGDISTTQSGVLDPGVSVKWHRSRSNDGRKGRVFGQAATRSDRGTATEADKRSGGNPESRRIDTSCVCSISVGERAFLLRDGIVDQEGAQYQKRPTASFAIDPPGFMAMAEGTGRVITGEEAHEINGRLRAKYLTAEVLDGVGSAWGAIDDVAVEITPLNWRSWSSQALTELSKEGAGDIPPADWWVPEDS